MDNICYEVSSRGCFREDTLCSDQEEADTKVVLHTIDALSRGGNVVIRSPSGDTDIFVIALGIVNDLPKVRFDYGAGKNRKSIWLDKIVKIVKL